jgi:uncharacterized protein (DUF849 family)
MRQINKRIQNGKGHCDCGRDRSKATREQNPHIPLTPEEIADSAYECFNEGASIVHFHVRDPKTQKRSMEPALFRRVVERLCSQCDMIINLTTGVGG